MYEGRNAPFVDYKGRPVPGVEVLERGRTYRMVGDPDYEGIASHQAIVLELEDGRYVPGSQIDCLINLDVDKASENLAEARRMAEEMALWVCERDYECWREGNAEAQAEMAAEAEAKMAASRSKAASKAPTLG